jgi:beta-mannanase
MARVLFGMTCTHPKGSNARAYEQAIGRPIDLFLLFSGDWDWGALAGVGGETARADDVWNSLGHQVNFEWSIPLFAVSDGYHNYGPVLSGAHDGDMYSCGATICNWYESHWPAVPEILIRLGWEMNVGGYNWSCAVDDESVGLEDEYAAAWARWVPQLRQASIDVLGANKIRMIWCPNSYAHNWDPFSCYPGDSLVDYVGTDQYWNFDVTGTTDPFAAFNLIVYERARSTHYLFTEGRRRGKGLMFNEWGVGKEADIGPEYIRLMREYCYQQGVHTATYWEEWSAYNGELWLNSVGDGSGTQPRRPVLWAEMRRQFGPTDAGGSPPAPPPPGPVPPPPPPPPPPEGGTQTGTEGPDTLSGGEGPDTLYGMGGDDALFGGGGDDVLDPGPGAGFYISAGGGLDTIIYKRGYGKGTLEEWVPGTEPALEIHGYRADEITIGPHSHAGQSGQIITFADGGHIWLPGVTTMTTAHMTLADQPLPPTPPPPPPVPPPSTGLTTWLGLKVPSDTPAGVTQFEQWLGRPVDGYLGYVDGSSWERMADPTWELGNLGSMDRRVFWSFPLIPEDGTTLAQGAAGEGDWAFAEFARRISGFRPSEPEMWITFGWEYNTTPGFPWAVEGVTNGMINYINAFRRAVDAFRSVPGGSRFRFVLCPGAFGGDSWMLPYPGDAYIDAIGMTFYWNPEWTSDDPAEAFEIIRTDFGLQDQVDFAAARGKRVCYPEWGVKGNNAGPYLEKARNWFAAHNAVFANYWNDDSDYTGYLSGDRWPATSAAFKQYFGPAAVPPAPPPPPPVGPVVIGAGAHALRVSIGQEATEGNALFTLSVDGLQYGGTHTALASHGAGQTQVYEIRADWADGEHTLTVDHVGGT